MYNVICSIISVRPFMNPYIDAPLHPPTHISRYPSTYPPTHYAQFLPSWLSSNRTRVISAKPVTHLANLDMVSLNADFPIFSFSYTVRDFSVSLAYSLLSMSTFLAVIAFTDCAFVPTRLDYCYSL